MCIRDRNDSEALIINNRREKKVITVELSSDEKIVYSQLGINPLIKLGKEYLSSNHVVRLEEINNKEKQITSEHNEKSNNKASSKKANKKTSNSFSREEVEGDDPKEVNPGNKLPKLIDENQEIEITDEIDNSRRKRRRSSAIIE